MTFYPRFSLTFFPDIVFLRFTLNGNYVPITIYISYLKQDNLNWFCTVLFLIQSDLESVMLLYVEMCIIFMKKIIFLPPCAKF